MLVGYARGSTVEQNLDLQRSALREVGCEKLYQDQILGTPYRLTHELFLGKFFIPPEK